MPAYHNTIDDIMHGTNKGIRRIIRGVPTGTTITQAWLTIKENETKTDAQALAQKTATLSATAQGQILDAGSSGIADIVFWLLPTDTIKLTPKKPFLYDVQVLLSDGRYLPADQGRIITFARISRVSGV